VNVDTDANSSIPAGDARWSRPVVRLAAGVGFVDSQDRRSGPTDSPPAVDAELAGGSSHIAKPTQQDEELVLERQFVLLPAKVVDAIHGVVVSAALAVMREAEEAAEEYKGCGCEGSICPGSRGFQDPRYRTPARIEPSTHQPDLARGLVRGPRQAGSSQAITSALGLSWAKKGRSSPYS
jgi:hypothetical protein